MSAPGVRAGVWGWEDTTPAHLHAAPQVPVAPARPLAGEQSWPPAPPRASSYEGSVTGLRRAGTQRGAFPAPAQRPEAFHRKNLKTLCNSKTYT